MKKKYKIYTSIRGGDNKVIITAKEGHDLQWSNAGLYYIRDEDGKLHCFPIQFTIIEEITENELT